MLNARLRLASLWLSQFARPVADWGLRLLVVRQLLEQNRSAAWNVTTALYMAPFILLAPFNGTISNGLPKRWVLIGACAVSLLGALLFGVVPAPALACLVLIAACTAVYSPTRYALLPAAAQDTHWPLTRINSWIEMGGAAGIVLGLMLGLQDVSEAHLGIVVAAAVALLAALPVVFVSDLRRPEPPLPAIRDFFGDCGRILRNPEARLPLLVLAGFIGVLSSGSGVVIIQTFDADTAQVNAAVLLKLLVITIGASIGALLAGWQKHLYRGLGLVPFGSAGLMLAFTWAYWTNQAEWPACLLMGLMGGLVSVPLRAYYQVNVPPDARGNAMAISNTANYLVMAALAGLLLLLDRVDLVRGLEQQMLFLAVVGVVGTMVLFWALFRQLLEIGFEVVLWPVYRIRAVGPGVDQFPLRGPVLVFANHAAWFDTLWIAKFVPRRVFPMMTSLFFDIPVLHWLMVHVVHAIRVPASHYRHDAPELLDAIALLDRGECVVIFPEGMMRRREEQLLRSFGQGIWRILKARPQTPVVACWIEGGWGSYMSYKGGLPTKNKKLDWWWPVAISVDAPQLLDPKLLDDLRTTRIWLRQACLNARRHLGLEVPQLRTSAGEEEEEKEGE